jgi:hypothetical protein
MQIDVKCGFSGRQGARQILLVGGLDIATFLDHSDDVVGTSVHERMRLRLKFVLLPSNQGVGTNHIIDRR